MKINRPFYKNTLCAVLFLTALLCVSCAFSQEESSFIARDAQTTWTGDGYPFLYARDRAALDGIEAALREKIDAATPFASAVDFQLRRQGARYKGKLLSVKGRLLRAVYVDLPDERGFYDLWILLPDAKRDPIRVIAFDAPKGFRVDGALENATPYPRDVQYRREEFEALAVYYRTTSFDAGDDFFTAPTLVALDFKTTPSPTSENAEKKSASRGVPLKGALFLVLVCLWLIARVSYKRALKRAKTESSKSKSPSKPGAALILAFLLGSAPGFAQDSATERDEFWSVASGASLDELTLEQTSVRAALDDPGVARRREIALTTLGRMERSATPCVLRERADEDVARFVGELKEVREIPLNESEKEKRGVEKLFRAVVALDSGGNVVVYAPKIPKFEAPDGFFDDSQESKRVAVEGFRFGFERVDREEASVLLATRVAWIPTNSPLGRAGVDLSGFESIPVFARDALEKAPNEEKKKQVARSLRFTTDDVRPFYESLAAIEKLRDDRAPILEGATLFVEPEKLQGRPVKLRGWARRVNMALVDDRDVIAATGVEKYWQIYFFTNDSQGAPLVLCALDLPEDLGSGGGKNFRREMELDGFFYKTWAYKTSETKRGEAKGKSKEVWTRAPLIIGRVTKVYPDEEEKSPAPVDASTIFAAFAFLAIAWIFLRRRGAGRSVAATILKK